MMMALMQAQSQPKGSNAMGSMLNAFISMGGLGMLGGMGGGAGYSGMGAAPGLVNNLPDFSASMGVW